MSYKIGIIGAGHIGQALALHLSKTGNTVTMTNRKGPASLRNMIESIGGNLRAGDLKQTIEESDILFLAVPWGNLEELAPQLEPYKGKILVDATNNIVSIFPLRVTDLNGKTTGEYTSSLFPGHRVVKGFNTLPSFILAKNPDTATGNTVIVLSGDDNEAKTTVAGIAAAMGFATIDIGTLKEGVLQDPGRALSNIELMKVKADASNR